MIDSRGAVRRGFESPGDPAAPRGFGKDLALQRDSGV